MIRLQKLNNIICINNIIIIEMGSQLCPASLQNSRPQQELNLNQSQFEQHPQKDQKISSKSTEIALQNERYVQSHHCQIIEQSLPIQIDSNTQKGEIKLSSKQNEITSPEPEKKYCEFQLPDKTIFKGITIDNIPNGYGEEYHSNGEVFMGNFVNGEKNGFGQCQFANKEIYEGDFSHNMMHGKGTYVFANGDKYIGNFVNNHREGLGRYIPKQPNEYKIEYFEGQYKQNERSGEGLIKYTTGEEFKGLWKHGLLLRTK